MLTKVIQYFVVTLVLLFVVGPLILVILLSLFDQPSTKIAFNGLPTLYWYRAILADNDIKQAWLNSMSVALPVGLLGAVGGFVCGLSWWYPKNRYILIYSSIILAIVPPTAQCIGLSRIMSAMGWNESLFFLVVLSHLLWVLPFCIVIIAAGVSQVSGQVIDAAFDLGGGRAVTAFQIVFRMIWPSVISAFLVGMLLSINEYVRSFYLSGPTLMLSRYIYGKMMSGADPRVYALGGINIAIAILVILLVSLGTGMTRRNAKKL